MAYDDLLPLLAAAQKSMRVRILGPEAMSDPLAFTIHRNFSIDRETEAALVVQLERHPELAIFDSKMQILGGFATRLTYENLAKWLVFRSLKTDIGEAVANVQRYISEDSFELLEIKAIGGIEVERQTPLAEGIQLAPFADVPASFAKAMLVERTWRFDPIPTAALVAIHHLPKVHVADSSDSLASETMREFHRKSRAREMEDARLCLTLMGPTGIAGFAHWTLAADWVPTSLLGSGMSYSTDTGFRETRKLAEEDVRKASGIILDFQRLSDALKSRLRVSLDWLGRGLRTSSTVDAAIALRIAMESVFLPDLEDLGEFGFRLRIRAARFLGQTRDERVALARLFRDLYDAGSAAVHTGRLEHKWDGRETTELLAEGFSKTALAVEKTIMEQGVDWNSVLYS